MLFIACHAAVTPRITRRSCYDIAAFFGSVVCTPEIAYAAQDGIMGVVDYFRALLPERRKNPGQDLVSLLVQAEEDGDLLTEEEILAQCSLLMFGGHETTKSLLGTGLWALLQNPDQWEMLRQNPTLMRDAIKELLRYSTPIQLSSRLATEDVNLFGQEVKQGQLIVLAWNSANRDPKKYTNPESIDITRFQNPNTPPHLAFGRGIHYCLGAGLATLETEIAFNTMMKRLPQIRLVSDQPDWNHNMNFWAPRTLPIAF